MEWRKFKPFLFLLWIPLYACNSQSLLSFTISFDEAEDQRFHVQMEIPEWEGDTLELKIPGWMPGYYQYMHYAENVENFNFSVSGKPSNHWIHPSENVWEIYGIKGRPVKVTYDVLAERRFVANSFVDTSHAYIIPESAFLYIDNHLQLPVQIAINPLSTWPDVVTGLDPNPEIANVFTAQNFDVLYDCPILAGKLTEFPAFNVHGIPHRFFAYRPGTFDASALMGDLKKVVTVATELIGDIPYHSYTFIGIGPGRGGIEHLNNTTVAFEGSQLQSESGRLRMLNFLAHEYFHHYNVKRIRPFELGPFDYDRGSKTNLLWISEGLTVYYEYLTVRRAGLMNEIALLNQLANNIKATEEDPGLPYQSLAQASYATWQDGPFGGDNQAGDRAISYYEKGPVVGLMLDFTIRHATNNEQSLDDVMRHLYNRFYQSAQRGFTDAEFQQTCEAIAGIPLDEFFEYIYTTKPLDYNRYLAYGGLRLHISPREIDPSSNEYLLDFLPERNELQRKIYNDWTRNASR
ncbi:MAG: M61 family metallopeptidase [Saprospiraceae bacterium]|nr:M61 family metallopeptidase [Saprospiraceae bacterium]